MSDAAKTAIDQAEKILADANEPVTIESSNNLVLIAIAYAVVAIAKVAVAGYDKARSGQ